MPDVRDFDPSEVRVGAEPTAGAVGSAAGTPEAEQDTATRLRIVVGKLSRRLGAPGAGSGFTPSQLSVLGTLNRLGPVRLSELAAIEGINPTMLSRIVGKLDDAGMITRRADDADRRAANVEITERGAAAFAAIRARRTAVLAAGLAELSPGHVQSLAEALDALEALVSALARAEQLRADQIPADQIPADQIPAELVPAEQVVVPEAR